MFMLVAILGSWLLRSADRGIPIICMVCWLLVPHLSPVASHAPARLRQRITVDLGGLPELRLVKYARLQSCLTWPAAMGMNTLKEFYHTEPDNRVAGLKDRRHRRQLLEFQLRELLK